MFPAAISQASLLSGGLHGVGGGDGLGNRRADVYSLGRWLLRVRFCSPLRSDGGARVPGVAVVLLRQRIMVFLLLLATVRRRGGQEFVPSVD